MAGMTADVAKATLTGILVAVGVPLTQWFGAHSTGWTPEHLKNSGSESRPAMPAVVGGNDVRIELQLSQIPDDGQSTSSRATAFLPRPKQRCHEDRIGDGRQYVTDAG